ncbi:MAG: DUF4292 domain-containing protein [Bacteroidales bacterium]|nr:DUF4292 domain-containing protein [Bacteroidales bacterium]
MIRDMFVGARIGWKACAGLLLTVGAIAVASCDKNRPPEPQPGVETVPQAPVPLKQYVETDTLDSYEYLSSNFTVSVRGINVNGVVRMHRDDKIWISVNKVFEIGRALFTQDSVFGYLKMGDKYVRCSYSDLRQALGAYVDYSTVQGVLTGKGSNTNLVQVEYDQFDTIGNEEFPLFIDVTLNNKDYYTNAQVRMSKLLLGDSTAALSFPIRIPPSAQRLWP